MRISFSYLILFPLWPNYLKFFSKSQINKQNFDIFKQVAYNMKCEEILICPQNCVFMTLLQKKN